MARRDHPVVGLGHRSGGQAGPQGGLVACRGDGIEGVVGQPQAGRGGRRHRQPLVVDGQDGVEGPPAMKGGDDLHRYVDVGQGDDHGPIAHGVGQGRAPLAADDHLHAETFGCGQEILGPVGLGGQQQEYPGHYS